MLGWNPQVPASRCFLKTPFGWRCTNAWNAGDCGLLKWSLAKSPRSARSTPTFLNHWGKLRFGPPVEAQAPKDLGKNPKRVQRQVKGQLQTKGVGTKAQQAVKAQQEAGKQSRLLARKTRTEEERQRLFALRQQKKKEKHKGR